MRAYFRNSLLIFNNNTSFAKRPEAQSIVKYNIMNIVDH
jgi:hypothetical protein